MFLDVSIGCLASLTENQEITALAAITNPTEVFNFKC